MCCAELGPGLSYQGMLLHAMQLHAMHLHICECTYLYMYVYTYTCIYMCMDVCMYARMDVCQCLHGHVDVLKTSLCGASFRPRLLKLKHAKEEPPPARGGRVLSISIMHACIHACMCVCMCLRVHVCSWHHSRLISFVTHLIRDSSHS